MAKNKNKKKGAPSTTTTPTPTKGVFKVGTMSDLIAASCGVSKPEFDPKLAALFPSTSSSTSNNAIVRLKKGENVESFPEPPQAPQKKDKFKLRHKDAAQIRVNAKFSDKTAQNVQTQQDKGEKTLKTPTLKKQKRLQRRSLQTKQQEEKEPEPEEQGDEDEIPEPSSSEQNEKGSNSDDDENEELVAPKKGTKKETVGEIKKKLKELNAPKDKDPEKESRTLFVGNVPKNASKQMIMKLFKPFGFKIECMRLRCAAPNKPTALKKVAINKKELHPDRASIVAYVRFSTREEAEKVMDKGKAESMTLGDHHLVLDLADRSIKKENKKAIFVGNLPLKIQDDELWEYFSECGHIDSVRVVRASDSGLGKGFGYVNFIDSASVELALKKDGEEINNRPLRVSRCVKKLKKTDNANSAGGGWKNPNKPMKGAAGRFASKNVENSTHAKKASFQGEQGKTNNNTSAKFQTKNKNKVSQGQRKRGEIKQFSGDRTAEVGKFKRNSKKPNRDDIKKAKIAKQLTSTAPRAISQNSKIPKNVIDYKAKKKEMRKKTKPRWPRNK